MGPTSGTVPSPPTAYKDIEAAAAPQAGSTLERNAKHTLYAQYNCSHTITTNSTGTLGVAGYLIKCGGTLATATAGYTQSLQQFLDTKNTNYTAMLTAGLN